VEEYHDLKKELSRMTRASCHESQLEEGPKGNDFDLDKFLNGMSNENGDSGQLPKHVGVTWRDLNIKVMRNSAHAHLKTRFS
jgi:hypothetical protein